MAITGDLTMTGVISGLTSGSRKELALSWSITAGVADIQTVALVTGDNTITIPTGATFMIVSPPSTATSVITVKGAGGDTGHKIAQAVSTPLTVDDQTTTILNVSANVTVEILFI